MEEKCACEVIVVIVNKGDAEKAVSAAKQAGAEGGTIIFGRGTGSRDQVTLFGIAIEPEKEVILILIDKAKTAKVLDAIVEAVGLVQPGKGIAFVFDVGKVVGFTPRRPAN